MPTIDFSTNQGANALNSFLRGFGGQVNTQRDQAAQRERLAQQAQQFEQSINLREQEFNERTRQALERAAKERTIEKEEKLRQKLLKQYARDFFPSDGSDLQFMGPPTAEQFQKQRDDATWNKMLEDPNLTFEDVIRARGVKAKLEEAQRKERMQAEKKAELEEYFLADTDGTEMLEASTTPLDQTAIDPRQAPGINAKVAGLYQEGKYNEALSLLQTETSKFKARQAVQADIQGATKRLQDEFSGRDGNHTAMFQALYDAKSTNPKTWDRKSFENRVRAAFYGWEPRKFTMVQTGEQLTDVTGVTDGGTQPWWNMTPANRAAANQILRKTSQQLYQQMQEDGTLSKEMQGMKRDDAVQAIFEMQLPETLASWGWNMEGITRPALDGSTQAEFMWDRRMEVMGRPDDVVQAERVQAAIDAANRAVDEFREGGGTEEVEKKRGPSTAKLSGPEQERADAARAKMERDDFAQRTEKSRAASDKIGAFFRRDTDELPTAQDILDLGIQDMPKDMLYLATELSKYWGGKAMKAAGELTEPLRLLAEMQFRQMLEPFRDRIPAEALPDPFEGMAPAPEGWRSDQQREQDMRARARASGAPKEEEYQPPAAELEPNDPFEGMDKPPEKWLPDDEREFLKKQTPGYRERYRSLIRSGSSAPEALNQAKLSQEQEKEYSRLRRQKSVDEALREVLG